MFLLRNRYAISKSGTPPKGRVSKELVKTRARLLDTHHIGRVKKNGRLLIAGERFMRTVLASSAGSPKPLNPALTGGPVSDFHAT